MPTVHAAAQQTSIVMEIETPITGHELLAAACGKVPGRFCSSRGSNSKLNGDVISVTLVAVELSK